MVLGFGTAPAQTKASSSFRSPPASSTSHNRGPRQKLPQALVPLFALGRGFRLPVPEVSSFPQVWATVRTRTRAVVAGQWLRSPTQRFLPGTDFSPSGTAGGRYRGAPALSGDEGGGGPLCPEPSGHGGQDKMAAPSLPQSRPPGPARQGPPARRPLPPAEPPPPPGSPRPAWRCPLLSAARVVTGAGLPSCLPAPPP